MPPLRWLENQLRDTHNDTQPGKYDALITLAFVVGMVAAGFVIAEVLGT